MYLLADYIVIMTQFNLQCLAQIYRIVCIDASALSDAVAFILLFICTTFYNFAKVQGWC
jgi:hypothetical protein